MEFDYSLLYLLLFMTPNTSLAYCGGLTLASRQTPTQSLTPLLSETRGENKMEKLMGWDEGREIIYKLQLQANQTQPGGNLLPTKIDLGRKK